MNIKCLAVNFEIHFKMATPQDVRVKGVSVLLLYM